MKKLILFLLILPVFCYSQDTEKIIMNNGTSCDVTILKINPDSVYVAREFKDQVYKQWLHASEINNFPEIYEKNKAIGNGLPLDENGKFYFEEIIQVPNVSADSIYLRLIDWYGQAFKNPESVIKFNNRETGKINGIFYDNYTGYKVLGTYYSMFLRSSINFVIKDGRFKVSIFDFESQSMGNWYSCESGVLNKYGNLRPMYKAFYIDLSTKVTSLIESIQIYVNSYKKINDGW